MTANTHSQQPLTIMGCIRASYSVLWDNRILFFKAAWLPILLLSLSAFVTPMPHFPLTAEGENDVAGALPAQPPHFGVASLVFGLGAWLLATSFQVTWQRFLVLGDRPSAFYFKAPFWSYLGAIFLLMLALMGWILLSYIPAIIIGVIVGVAHGRTSSLLLALIPVLIACLIPTFIWFFRRILMYPARALGDTGLTWKQSSLAMRGHTAAYLGASILAYLPFMLPSIAIMAIVFRTTAPFPSVVLYGLQVIEQTFAFGGIAVAASVLTFFYVGLIEKKPVA